MRLKTVRQWRMAVVAVVGSKGLGTAPRASHGAQQTRCCAQWREGRAHRGAKPTKVAGRVRKTASTRETRRNSVLGIKRRVVFKF